MESTLYPFIGGDTVRREEMKVAGLQPSINMILPYATPKLSGCSREALVEFSACCIENSRDLLQVLEAEYRKQYAKNLTLSRLSEAVILPLCPDKGSCMEYDENLAASVYLENDLEMLQRMRKFMVTIQSVCVLTVLTVKTDLQEKVLLTEGVMNQRYTPASTGAEIS